MKKDIPMTTEEIKIRQLTNQYLITPADKLTVVRDLCGIQSQYMVNAMHSLKIRCNDYDERTVADGLVKNWTLRGTVHVFAQEDLPLFLHCNDRKDYLRNEWNGQTFWNQRDRWALTPERQKYLSEVIMSSVSQAPRTRDELKAICHAHGMTDSEEGSMFDPWGGGIRELCERGFMNYVVQEKKAYCIALRFTPIPQEEAELEIARRYFTNIAPATIRDAMYFLGAKQSQVKKWMEQLPLKSAECEGKTYYYIDTRRAYDHEIPPCIFLAGFDQLMLGYQKTESLFLPQEHLRKIFNLAGIVMPAILLNGTVAGQWKKNNRKLKVTLFSNIQSSERAVICEKAESLWSDLSDIQFV